MKALATTSAKSNTSFSTATERTTASPVQCKGYEARTSYPLPPLQRKENGTGLPDELKNGVESLSGLSLDDVNVHYNSPEPATLQAHAYAQGTEIYVGPGQEKHLPHEAWHVVQQKQGRVEPMVQMKGLNINHDSVLEKEADLMGSRAQRTGQAQAAASPAADEQTHTPTASPVQKRPGTNDVVQADIGFEFETKSLYTKRSHTNNLPANGFANAAAGQTAWFAANSTRVEKGATLLKRADIEVQADDWGSDSDLEVVTTHFPLNAGGRTRLDNAMTDLDALITTHQGFSATGGGYVPAKALNGQNNFRTKMQDGMFLGNWRTGTTAPQVTFGTRVQNIADIVRDLHGDPTETGPQKTARDPGRLHMRKPKATQPNEPRDLGVGEESQTLITGHTLARDAIRDYQLIDVTAPGGPALEGFLTLIFAYVEAVPRKQSFLKNHTPLMAKTNLATIFATLPAAVKAYYSQKDVTGKSNLEKIVETSPGYGAKLNQPLFAGVSGLAEDNTNVPGQAQWYHNLTLEDWLNGLVLRDRTKGEAFKQFFYDNYGGSTKRPGKDKLTTKTFPNIPQGQEVEGYGALGKRMDTDINNPATKLPVFELRSASRMITFAAARQWALEFFDYVQSLNANPVGGGHTLMP